MSLWPLLVLDFLIQEPMSSSALMLAAYQQHYNLWAVHALFLAATALDASVGYWLGTLLKRRFSGSRASAWITKHAQRLETFAGRHGKRAALLLIGPTFFPVSAIAAPWLGFTFLENLVLSLIGDTVLWYGSTWLIVLGVKSVVLSPVWSLFATAGITLIVVLVSNYGIALYARNNKNDAN